MSLHRGWTTAICCASGPSFSPEQAAMVIAARARGLCNVIVVNNQYQHVPNADAVYASDAKWWGVHLPQLNASGFAGELWTLIDEDPVSGPPRHAWHLDARKLGLRQVRSIRGDYLPPDPDLITQGSNSGHAAMQLAARFMGNAGRLIMVGYDLQRAGGKEDGRGHNHPDHASPLGNGNPAAWVPRFTPLAETLAAAGIDVVNATADTALTQFRREPLDVALGMVTA